MRIFENTFIIAIKPDQKRSQALFMKAFPGNENILKRLDFIGSLLKQEDKAIIDKLVQNFLTGSAANRSKNPIYTYFAHALLEPTDDIETLQRRIEIVLWLLQAFMYVDLSDQEILSFLATILYRGFKPMLFINYAKLKAN